MIGQGYKRNSNVFTATYYYEGCDLLNDYRDVAIHSVFYVYSFQIKYNSYCCTNIITNY
jgi:hypothetical protein